MGTRRVHPASPPMSYSVVSTNFSKRMRSCASSALASDNSFRASTMISVALGPNWNSLRTVAFGFHIILSPSLRNCSSAISPSLKERSSRILRTIFRVTKSPFSGRLYRSRRRSHTSSSMLVLLLRRRRGRSRCRNHPQRCEVEQVAQLHVAVVPQCHVGTLGVPQSGGLVPVGVQAENVPLGSARGLIHVGLKLGSRDIPRHTGGTGPLRDLRKDRR